jgi:DNA-directed RNA polymerase subunit beta'
MTWSSRRKEKLVNETRDLVKEYEQQYIDGLITQGEKYNKVVDAWAKCTDKVADEMMARISAVQKDEETGREKPINSVYMMAHSGARGSPAQMKQLAGMRGLMAKPSGEIIETPIISNFKEGLTVLEYFNSTHGARKGLADTALKTANSGYLTRRLVDVAQDAIIAEEDCGTEKGDYRTSAVIDAGEVIASLGSRVWAARRPRTSVIRQTNEVIIPRGREHHRRRRGPDRGLASIQELRIRSVLTCETRFGVCAKCYGRDLARGTRSISARLSALSPPSRSASRAPSSPCAPSTSAARRRCWTSRSWNPTMKARAPAQPQRGDRQHGPLIIMGRNVALVIEDEQGHERAVHKLTQGARLFVNEGDK